MSTVTISHDIHMNNNWKNKEWVNNVNDNNDTRWQSTSKSRVDTIYSTPWLMGKKPVIVEWTQFTHHYSSHFCLDEKVWFFDYNWNPLGTEWCPDRASVQTRHMVVAQSKYCTLSGPSNSQGKSLNANTYLLIYWSHNVFRNWSGNANTHQIEKVLLTLYRKVRRPITGRFY